MSPRWSVVVLAVLIASCTVTKRDGGYYPGDGPPGRATVDLDHVPDAVPRAEPLSKYGNDPYTALGTVYRPMKSARGYHARGKASWYGRKFHGRRTSSGEPYNMYLMTAAHPTLPLPSYVRVTNIDNNRSVVVRVNDRGPFLHERVIDLSYVAAHKLGMLGTGTARVDVVAINPGESAPAAPVATPAPIPEMQVNATARSLDKPIPVPPAEGVTGPRIYVQVGAFSEYANATALKTRLEAAGHAPVEIGPLVVGQEMLYRVRIGPLASNDEAQRTLQRVGGAMNGVPRVVVDIPDPAQGAP